MGKPGKEDVERMCRQALFEIEKEIAVHNKGKRGLLSPAILVLVKEQVRQMMEVLDPQQFAPSYPGNLVGTWMDDPLGAKLVELSFFYRQLK